MIEDTEERAVRYVPERDEDGHAMPMVFRAVVDPIGLDRVLTRMQERLDALEREVREMRAREGER